MIKILIVDDTPVNLAVLHQTLQTLGEYTIIEAVDGFGAVSQFEKESPDLIIMDMMMPGMDGCEATTKIKKMAGDEYVPVIFLTALTSDNSLAEALSSGGDDFISKPYNIGVLHSKILAHLRIRELSKQISIKNAELIKYTDQLEFEQVLIEHFFENAMQNNVVNEDAIKYSMSSMAVFNGDIFVTATNHENNLVAIVGDFTGHGLTAAMGTLPVIVAFRKAIEMGASLGDIAKEINHHLYNLLPSTMFLCASIVEINIKENFVSLWSGGMPDTIIFDNNNKLRSILKSKNMPLGIVGDEEFSAVITSEKIKVEDKIYLYSDGILESKNNEGELYGDGRFIKSLEDGAGDRFDYSLQKLSDFCQKSDQNDDITLVELNCIPLPVLEDEGFPLDDIPSWSLSVKLETFSSTNAVNNIISTLNSIGRFPHRNNALYIILTEIFCNSLDHSLLGLDSIDKSDPDAFYTFYEKRARKIRELKDAYIQFDFRFHIEDEKRLLEIKASDSGTGLVTSGSRATSNALHGRGLKLINQMCLMSSFSEDGKIFTALYQL